MAFRAIPAGLVASGALGGTYTLPGHIVTGDPASSRVIVGTDPTDGHSVVRLYALDGVTRAFDADATTGTVTIQGSSVAGTVAHATAADTVPGSGVAGAVGSATTATTATNLAGGGTAAGSTTISGALVVGNPSTSHVVVGSDALGANGVRLYDVDGVTPLIDLTISGTPTITGAIFQTRATGARVRITGQSSANAWVEVQILSGNAAETYPGVVSGGFQSRATGKPAEPYLRLESGTASPTGSQASGIKTTIMLYGGDAAGTDKGVIQLFAGPERIDFDGITLAVGNANVGVNLLVAGDVRVGPSNNPTAPNLGVIKYANAIGSPTPAIQIDTWSHSLPLRLGGSSVELGLAEDGTAVTTNVHGLLSVLDAGAGGFLNVAGATASNSGGFGAALSVRTPGGVAGRSPLLVQGITGQTGHLTEWLVGSTLKAYVAAAGWSWWNGGVTAGPGADATTAGSAFWSPGTGSVVTEIRGLSGQNADLTQWQNNTGGRLAGVTGGGLGIFQNLQIDSPVTGNTAAAGGNGALPATVGGYLNIALGGTVRKIPYYV